VAEKSRPDVRHWPFAWEATNIRVENLRAKSRTRYLSLIGQISLLLER
jgi:hypothetical protein